MNIFLTKLQLSLKSIAKVLLNWRYSMIAAFFAVVFINLLYWLLNMSLFWLFITTDVLSPIEKVDLLSSTILSYISSLPFWQAFVIVALSAVQGIVISTLIYVIKSQNKVDKKALSGTTLAGFVGMLSVGCVSCGTSIVAPIIGLFASGASASLSEAIHKVAIVIGLIIALYALYTVGLSAANVQAKSKASKS